MEIKKTGFIGRQLLRLLKPGRATSSSVTLNEEDPRDSAPGSVIQYHERTRKAILIMIEQKKAQGLTAWEKRRYPY
ncbi:MAG: hypothetical protein JSV35_02445 [Candidatus Bathyarchaeota archaeon]|nr:MAG: hypothetical protein JSV35_02445 [Candidatus Bathyarchaeota archaeon]